MSRSVWKGPFVDMNLVKKAEKLSELNRWKFNALKLDYLIRELIKLGAKNNETLDVVLDLHEDIKLDEVLGSKSYYPQISHSSIIEKGDEFKFEANDRNITYKSIDQKFRLNKNIKVFRGPEFNCLNKESINKLKNQEFSIGINNRMAYNLKEKIEAGVNSIISSGVIPGTVQLTPSGQIIILHRDCQTTGGYPRILQLAEKSLNNLAQLRTGDKIKFEIVSL